MIPTMRIIVVAFLFAANAFAQNDAGEVAFANSGAPEAQAPFLRGLALLHDFEYESAAQSFRRAETIDPSFAMAYWGEAMTYTHPVWFQQEADSATAALKRLGATPAERLAKAKTERERDYLRAVEVLYGDGTKDERDFKYADAMRVVHERYPDDVDATAFYALALLGTSHQGRDFPTYMRAAALLEEVLPAHPQHPGVLHYLIHCYDDPIHAPLGLRAARRYGVIAPGAGHALHMTSHIFIAMGMWDDVIDANRRAIDVVNKQRAARSKPPVACGHYPLWLHYAYLQRRKFDEARTALDACRESAFDPKFETLGPMDTAAGRMESFADMRAHQVASRGLLTAADNVAIPDGPEFANARFLVAYGDVLLSSVLGQTAALKTAVARLHGLQQAALQSVEHQHSMNAMNPTFHIRAEVMVQQADALQLAAEGKRDEAIAMLQKAAAAETSMPFEFGPPVVEKPTYELLGDELLAAGRATEAAAAYRSALERTPGRATSVDGLAKALKTPDGPKALSDLRVLATAPSL
jgi:tetratricopeptide (TPR) repeat protein